MEKERAEDRIYELEREQEKQIIRRIANGINGYLRICLSEGIPCVYFDDKGVEHSLGHEAHFDEERMRIVLPWG